MAENHVPEAPGTPVAPGPHISDTTLTTRRMMLDVIIGLVPVLAVSLWVFELYALKQIILCVGGCMAAEMIFTWMRGRKATLGDLSAVVTGLILAFSMPGTAPWYIGIIGAFTAIGLGKIVFGGLGYNIFNPAMVGRAFAMIAFTAMMGATAYVAPGVASADAISQATPMTAAWQGGQVSDGLLWRLFLGTTNGSLGETSALACLVGGMYLCIRRTASWEIPAGAIVGLLTWAGIANLLNPGADWTVLHHLFGGAFLLGSFFIITDPVSSPLTPKGKWIFGAIFGVLVMFLRTFSAYPEGVMFSVLLVNGVAPLINRWTVPRPLGGPVPQKA
jgi:Na+-translocating ferredoxin:NAD+ oxidoreductase subunit D